MFQRVQLFWVQKFLAQIALVGVCDKDSLFLNQRLGIAQAALDLLMGFFELFELCTAVAGDLVGQDSFCHIFEGV